MAQQRVCIANIGRLVTMGRVEGSKGLLGVVEQAAVCIDGEKISWVGPAHKLPAAFKAAKMVDAQGGVVFPGLIDCHTHVVHGGSRQQEFALRSQGVDYQEIAAQGGGIMSTVRATRGMTVDELYTTALQRADEAFSWGTTAMEVKSGYGLDMVTELNILEVIEILEEHHAIDFRATFLGAHVVPGEYQQRRKEYIELVIKEMLPRAAHFKTCTACDVFIEEGAFTIDEARAICTAAKEQHLNIRLHVDQFQDGDGALFAAEVGAMSADHLDHISDAGIRAMVKAGVVGVVLPGASFFAGKGHYPPARKMIDMGLRIALATDYNPGTNPNLNLWLMASIAVAQMGLTVDEALQGITMNAAFALGLERQQGSIEVGKKADLVVLDAPDEYFPLYRYGKPCVRMVIKNGVPWPMKEKLPTGKLPA